LALLLVLGGCATPRVGGSDGFSGRMAVQVEAYQGAAARNASTQFELRGTAQRGDLQITSPLGNLLAQARWQPGEVQLVTSDGTQTYASLDAMSQQLLGERLPMAALIDWLGGKPWPEAPSQPLAAGPGFEQLGWSIDLARFDEGFVVATRAQAPRTTVRVRLERSS
jgi:outer membrane lipoprotein LolB